MRSSGGSGGPAAEAPVVGNGGVKNGGQGCCTVMPFFSREPHRATNTRY